MTNGVEFWEDYEALEIETPEALVLRQPLAGFGPRFLALFIDMLLQSLAATIAIVFVISMTIPVTSAADNEAFLMTVIIVTIVILLVVMAYPFIFELLWNGQTPGKRLTGIRVIRRGGFPIGLREVMLRNLMRIVDYLPSHGFIGMISFMVTRNQQRLGDLVADTVVVREFTSRHPFSWAATATGAGSGTSPWLNPRLSYVVASYLRRFQQLTPEVRFDLTGQLISRIGYDPQRLSLTEREEYLQALLRGPQQEQA